MKYILTFVVAVIVTIAAQIAAFEIPRQFVEYQEPETSTINVPIECGSTEKILLDLKEQYNEDLFWIGGRNSDESNNEYLSVWGNEATGSWTILITNRKDLVTCYIGSGDAFQYFSSETTQSF